MDLFICLFIFSSCSFALRRFVALLAALLLPSSHARDVGGLGLSFETKEERERERVSLLWRALLAAADDSGGSQCH